MDLSLCLGTIFSSFRQRWRSKDPTKANLWHGRAMFPGPKLVALFESRQAAILFADREAEATQHPALAASHASSQKWREKKACVLEHGACCVAPSGSWIWHTLGFQTRVCRAGGGRSISHALPCRCPQTRLSLALPPEPRPDCSAALLTPLPRVPLDSCASVGWRQTLKLQLELAKPLWTHQTATHRERSKVQERHFSLTVARHSEGGRDTGAKSEIRAAERSCATVCSARLEEIPCHSLHGDQHPATCNVAVDPICSYPRARFRKGRSFLLLARRRRSATTSTSRFAAFRWCGLQ